MENELESSSFLVIGEVNYQNHENDSLLYSTGVDVRKETVNDIISPAPSTILTRGGLKSKKDKMKERLAKMTQESSILATKRLQKRNASILKIQKCWQKYCSHRDFVLLNKLLLHYQLLSLYTRRKYIERRGRAMYIQHWWRACLDRQQAKLIANFTQQNRWTIRQSNLVLALLLGYRLRKLMKLCPAIVSARSSMKDAWQVLEGLAQDACTAGQSASNPLAPSEVSPYDIIKVSLVSGSDSNVLPTSFGVDGPRLFRVWNCGVAYKIDWPFARIFAKQVLSSRQVIWKYAVEFSKWCSFPPPGYWHVRYWHQQEMEHGVAHRTEKNTGSSKLTLVKKKATELSVDISSREMGGNDMASSHPNPKQPHVQSLGSILTRNRRQKQRRPKQYSESDDGSDAVLTVKSIQLSAGDEKPIAPMRGSLLGSISGAPGTLSRPHTAPMSYKESAMTVPVPPVSKRKSGYGPRPHLQICVTMAEKLPATRKRSSHGRRPGFKLTLFLPSKSSAASVLAGESEHMGPLKLVQTYIHDSHEVTLDPVWNDCTYFSLPIPQSSVPSTSPPAADVGYLGCVSGEVLLKEYWSRGSIKVEVMDGDRFNEDTHLGEIDLLMSGFLDLPKAKSAAADSTSAMLKTISGTFPLSRKSASDRSGGAVHLTAYLHMPEIMESDCFPCEAELAADTDTTHHRAGVLRNRPSTAAHVTSAMRGSEKPSSLHPPLHSTMQTPPRLRSGSEGAEGRTSGRHITQYTALPASAFDTSREHADVAIDSKARTPFVCQQTASSAAAAAMNKLKRSPLSTAPSPDGLTASERRRRKTTAIDLLKESEEDNHSLLPSELTTPQRRSVTSTPHGSASSRNGSKGGSVSTERRSRASAAPVLTSPATNPFQAILEERVKPEHGEVLDRDVQPPLFEVRDCKHVVNEGMRQSRISLQFQQLDLLASSLRTDADSAMENLSRKLKENRLHRAAQHSADETPHGNVSEFVCGIKTTNTSGDSTGNGLDEPMSTGTLGEITARGRKLVLSQYGGESSLQLRTESALADAENLLAKFDKRLNRASVGK